ncbi:hypothetical protein VKT23_001687 [Stygiomarasmius scandens]|uniref:Peptidase S59 domain-containing protein n=1 Tax=Marasmiellus scandens TaxID=2682957 RepID=A0ABR1K560_9AGAR
MFGNAITSSWGNNQQNQQQQPGAFGQPNTFGSTTTGFGSGSTSAFGQPQQPPANPMFGNLGGTGTTPGTSGFGAFSNNNNSSGSVFGAPKPATGFGAFGGGGTSTFGGGTGAFGGGGGATSAFGQPSTSTNTGSVFGGGGAGIFGQNKGTSAFGSTTTTTPTSNPVTTGSSNPPYVVHTEKDPSSTNITLQYQSISCIPAYQGTSFEELRFQDYQQGRKTAQASTGAFGQSSAFGTQPQTNSVFGQPQTQQTNSVFGAPKPPTGFGAFGGTNTNTAGTSIFGGGGNTFGQTPQPQQQQQSTGFGAFGQTQQQQQQQPQQQQQQGTGLFGNTNTAGGAFGTGGSTFGSGGAFGQQPQQPQQQQQTSIFGQPQQQPSTNTGFGTFGNNNASKPSIFGQPAQPAQNTTTGFGSTGTGLFGNNNQTQPGQQTSSIFGNTSSTGTGLFGNANNQQQQQQGAQPAGSSIFGNTQNQNTGTAGTGLFSGGGGGGNLFGNNNQQQQQPAQNAFGTGLFGNKTTTPVGNTGTNPFGSTFQTQQPANNAQQGPGLFSNLGQSTNQQQQSNLGAGMFGNANKAPGLGTSTSTGGTNLFGSTLGASTNTFNASAAAPGAQGTLTASISQPISTNLPIFSMLPPGPRSVDLDQSTKKKPGFFIDVPTRSPVPRVQLGYTPANSRLRGFGSSTSYNTGGNLLSSSSSVLTVSRSQTPKVDVFANTMPSPSLGSGQRKSVKKLILDKKVEPTELFTKSGSGSPLRGAKITFSPALSIAAREKEVAEAVAAAASSAPSQPAKSPTPTPRPQRTPNRFTAENGADGEEPLQEGDYWVKPSIDVLKTLGFDQLSSFEGLVVGRVGYGEIHFLEPVDLTGVPRLVALLGEIIKFDDKECAVYPDSEDDKPPPGSGLNVRARISLKRCWATDKAHREPIKDEKHPMAIRHLKRLKGMKDTQFESFDISDGTWTFTVDHF